MPNVPDPGAEAATTRGLDLRSAAVIFLGLETRLEAGFRCDRSDTSISPASALAMRSTFEAVLGLRDLTGTGSSSAAGNGDAALDAILIADDGVPAGAWTPRAVARSAAEA